MQACIQGMIVSKHQFRTIASKEIYVLFRLVLIHCLIVWILVGVIRVVPVNLVLVLSLRILFLHSCNSPFGTYLIYFTFINSVAINNDYSRNKTHFRLRYLMQACIQGMIVSKHQFRTIASKEIYVLFRLVLILCLIVWILVGVIRVVPVNLVLVLSLRLLFLHSFNSPFGTYLIYFTFINSVAINNDLRQPLS